MHPISRLHEQHLSNCLLFLVITNITLNYTPMISLSLHSHALISSNLVIRTPGLPRRCFRGETRASGAGWSVPSWLLGSVSDSDGLGTSNLSAEEFLVLAVVPPPLLVPLVHHEPRAIVRDWAERTIVDGRHLSSGVWIWLAPTKNSYDYLRIDPNPNISIQIHILLMDNTIFG